MANSFTQIYLHFVFSVQGRQSLIKSSFKEKLNQYITGIVKNEKQKMLAINSASDHIHLFIGVENDFKISDFIRVVKTNSSKYINDNKYTLGKFSWQKGYGVFSYSHSHIDNVIKYIMNQEEHHKKKSFKEEFLELLNKFDIKYNDDYLFEWIDKE